MQILPFPKQQEFIERVFDFYRGYQFTRAEVIEQIGEDGIAEIPEDQKSEYLIEDIPYIDIAEDACGELDTRFSKKCCIQKHSDFAYGGGFGGGKTYVCLVILMLLAKFFPGSKWIIMRKSMPAIERTVHQTWMQIFPRHFFRRIQKVPDIIYEAKNGSQIVFMAENFAQDPDLDRFKSLEMNGGFLEQIEEIQYKTYEMFKIRSGRWNDENGAPRIILSSFNPTPLWPREKLYDPYMKNELPEGVYYMEAKLKDNPHLLAKREYMKEIERMDPLTAKRYIEGDWDAFDPGDPWAYAFDERKHVSAEAEYDPREFAYISFDFNVAPMTAGVHQHGRDRNGRPWIYRVDEINLSNSNIYEMCAEIRQRYGKIMFFNTGDSAGHSRQSADAATRSYYAIIQQELGLPNNCMKAPRSNFRLKTSRVLVNTILHRHTKFLINPKCTETIKDLKFVQAMPDDTINKAGDKRRTHQLDNFRYYLETFHGNFIEKIQISS